jgi:hypothetical protein
VSRVTGTPYFPAALKNNGASEAGTPVEEAVASLPGSVAPVVALAVTSSAALVGVPVVAVGSTRRIATGVPTACTLTDSPVSGESIICPLPM